MKHFFIINPVAGKCDATKEITNKVKNIFQSRNEKFQIFVTTGEHDATEIINRESRKVNDEVTFYICGGDGTCNEALNGIMGKPHVRMTIIPTGSCNDFLKNFPNYDFMNISSLIDGEERLIDVLKVNDNYCLNVANIGYDAKVNFDCVRLKKRFKTTRSAYNYALFINLLKKLGDQIQVSVDNKELYNGKALLMAIANGGFYGGGFNCAPKAVCDDGLLDIIIVKKVSRLTFARLVKYYKKGLHLSQDRFKKIITFKQGSKIRIVSNYDLNICLDGENYLMKEVLIEVIPQAIRFVFPKEC